MLNAATQLDYRPSALGRNLRQRRSGGIGLLVPDITDSFYGRLADGVLACARSAGEPVVLGTTGDDAEREAEQIGMLLEQGVERVVAVPAGNAEIWEPTLRTGLTMVFAHRPVTARDDVPAVLADDRAGVRTAVDYLTGLGHRRIAYLGGPGQGQRVAAFRQSVGALLDEELIVFARGSRDSAYAAAAASSSTVPT
nr:hypothetical protein GCM10020093_037820 [Planobispora longispora]